MPGSTEIQFVGPSWGQHGPYTFFRSFSFRRSSCSAENVLRSVSVGQFFFVRILSRLPICLAELQLLWESRKAVGTKLASVKLYFTPDDTPPGRLSHHGEDELLVADEKVVLEVSDLVKWVVDGPVTWPYGFQMPHPHQKQLREGNDQDHDVSMATEDEEVTSSQPKKNGFKELDVVDDTNARRHGDPIVVIVTYSQYCRYRALAKRLEGGDGAWMKHIVVMAMSGLAVARDDATRLMFCRETFTHPELMFHDFRRDRLAPKLKGRKRRRKLSRLDSMESVDSDAGQVAMTTEDEEGLQRTKTPLKRFKGLTMTSSSGLELISTGKDAFEQRLYKFMRDRKTPIKRIPSLGFKEVDLFQFFIYSQKFGGYDKVTEGRHWKQIYDQMGGHPGNTSAATCTRRIYEKLLLTFERHVRNEEDKPLPLTYMRPARKKLRELATMRDRHLTLVSHDRPRVTESVPAPDVDDLSVAMVTGNRKHLEIELVPTIDVIAKTSCPVVPVTVKMEVSDGQSQLTDGQPNVPLAVSPPPPQSILKLKLKRGNSPSQMEFKIENLKDQTVPESVRGSLVSPPVVQEATPTEKVNSSLVLPLTGPCTNPVNRTPAGSRLSIDQLPCVKGDSLLKTQHPFTSYALPFFAPSATSFASSGLEKPAQSIMASATPPGVLGVLVATTTTAPSRCLLDQSPVSKNQVTLAPFGFLPPRIILSSTPAGSVVRTSIIRPTYGPPNIVAPFTPTSSGLLVPVFDANLPSVLCRPVCSTDLQKPLIRHSFSSSEKTPPSPSKTSARPSSGSTASSTGSWFNSPIKQFLDRTRALTSDAHSTQSDDQPMDLSVRATQKSSQDSARGGSDSNACTRAEQEEPLNLSKKHGGTKVAANLVSPAAATKKSTGSPALSGGGSLGRVVLPKSELLMPLILSVPSPVNILAQSTTVAAITSAQNSLRVTPVVVTNSAPHAKKVPANNGLLPVPTTVLSPTPFPTSLVGAAIGPVFQFFPSHPLASNIAYASEGGRSLLLRFPMPVPPSSLPPFPPAQAPPLPPPSLLASKGNKLN